MKEKFHVPGMSCSACSSHVEKSVSKLEGIKTVSVNLLTNSMQVEYDETKLDTGKIIEAVEHAGYGASVKEDGKAAVKAGETEDAVFIPQKQGGRAQGLALFGVFDEVVVRSVVLGRVANVFQTQNVAGAANLAAGDVPVADVHDRVLVVQRQVVEHELDVRPKVRLQQIHEFMQPFLVFLIRKHALVILPQKIILNPEI